VTAEKRPPAKAGRPASGGPSLSAPRALLRTKFVEVDAIDANFGSFCKEFHVVRFGPRAGIVIRRDDCLLLVRQWRFLPLGESWELPGGSIEAGEAAAEGARRECAEETGVVCGSLQPLCRYFPGLDNVDNETHLFYCHEVVEERQFVPSLAEILERRWLPFEQAVDDIAGGRITDAMTVAGISFYATLMARSLIDP